MGNTPSSWIRYKQVYARPYLFIISIASVSSLLIVFKIQWKVSVTSHEGRQLPAVNAWPTAYTALKGIGSNNYVLTFIRIWLICCDPMESACSESVVWTNGTWDDEISTWCHLAIVADRHPNNGLNQCYLPLCSLLVRKARFKRKDVVCDSWLLMQVCWPFCHSCRFLCCQKVHGALLL